MINTDEKLIKTEKVFYPNEIVSYNYILVNKRSLIVRSDSTERQNLNTSQGF